MSFVRAAGADTLLAVDTADDGEWVMAWTVEGSETHEDKTT